MDQESIGLKVTTFISGSSEYDCPSCKQTLQVESFGDFECPYCNHEFNYGVDELRNDGPLWKDQSPMNRKISKIISIGAGLVGTLILLTAIVLPPLAVIIFIPYVIIMPRVLEAKGIIGSDWRRGDEHGGSGGG